MRSFGHKILRAEKLHVTFHGLFRMHIGTEKIKENISGFFGKLQKKRLLKAHLCPSVGCLASSTLGWKTFSAGAGDEVVQNLKGGGGLAEDLDLSQSFCLIFLMVCRCSLSSADKGLSPPKKKDRGGGGGLRLFGAGRGVVVVSGT